MSKAHSRNSRSSQSRGGKLSSKQMTRDTQSLHKVQRLHPAGSNHLLKRGWYLHIFFFWDNFKHINVARLMQMIPVYPFSRVPVTSSLARGCHPGSFSCHSSLASFTLELLISFSLTFTTLTFFFFFFVIQDSHFAEWFSGWVCLMFPLDHTQRINFWLNFTEQMQASSHCTLSGGTWYLFVPILSVSPFITWLIWCLPESYFEIR